MHFKNKVGGQRDKTCREQGKGGQMVHEMFQPSSFLWGGADDNTYMFFVSKVFWHLLVNLASPFQAPIFHLD